MLDTTRFSTMLKFNIHITIISFFLIVSVVSEKKETKAHENRMSDILNKFHQTDYNVTLEWVEMVRFNEVYVKDYQLHVFKYNRTCAAVNATFDSNFNIGNNMELTVQGYKFASNEYRLFPLRFQANYCDCVAKDIVGMGGFKIDGNFSCPIVKGGHYHYFNWKPNPSILPPFIPNGQYMFEIQATYYSNEIFLEKYYGSVTRQLAWQ